MPRFIAKYINFDLTRESTCSSITLATFYQATCCHITMLNSAETKSYLNCAVFFIEERDGWSMWHACEKGEVHAGCW